MEPLMRPVMNFTLAPISVKEVALIGGHNSAGSAFDIQPVREVHSQNIITGSWSRLPDLNEERTSHFSLRMGTNLYVFGDDDDGMIEVLNVRDLNRGWQICAITGYKDLTISTVCPLGYNEFAIFGTYESSDQDSDEVDVEMLRVLIVDVGTLSIV